MTPGILKLSLEECEKSTYRFKMGAVVFKGTRILASGHNGIRSSRIHPLHKYYNNSLHAEQDCILNVKDWSTLKGCSILVMRISPSKGILGMSEPCEICMGILNHVGIKNIYYTNQKGEIVKY